MPALMSPAINLRCCLILSIFSAAPIGLAQATNSSTPHSGPATTAGIEKGPLAVTVADFKGIVQYRETEDGAWKRVAKGLVLQEGAEFRTGPRSSVVVTLPGGQTAALDRLGVVKVVRASFEGEPPAFLTDIGMKYGRTRLDVQTSDHSYDATIRSASSTLAVRGTTVSLSDQPPFEPTAVSLTGRAEFRDFRQQVHAVGAKNGSRAVIRAGSPTAAQTALADSVADPSISRARSGSEVALVNTLISNGAIVNIDQTTGIRIVRGGTVPSDTQLRGVLPGVLNFVLRWKGDANLDLGVGNQAGAQGEFLFPVAGLNTTPSGGRVAFDHRGGANGGIEVQFWPTADFPKSIYSLGVRNVSGQTATARVNVFLNGKSVPITLGLGTEGQETSNLKPGQTDAALVFIGVNPPPIFFSAPDGKSAIAKSATAKPTGAEPANARRTPK